MPDNLTASQRSLCMSRVRNKDTSLESLIRGDLHRRGLRFRKHVRTLPGTPDVVFPRHRVAILIEGDFWHGWRFPSWRHRVSPFWQFKIEKNRRRDQSNVRKLRAMGWTVLRLWQHQIERDFDAVIRRILVTLARGEHPSCRIVTARPPGGGEM